MDFTDILYRVDGGAAWITINRPEVYNALRYRTGTETIAALHAARDDADAGVVVLTGAGEKAFCAGADLRAPEFRTGAPDTPDETVSRTEALSLLTRVEAAIRDIPKPVVAMVNGAAMGAGQVINTLCDLSIAADSAKFSNAGTRVGKVDPGWGTAYLARVVGEKKAREMWMLCDTYTAQDALAMGLVNKVVPRDRLEEETRAWVERLLAVSPSALALAKQSFNADTASIQGVAHMGMAALDLLWDSEESVEGITAFLEKRTPDYARFRKGKKK